MRLSAVVASAYRSAKEILKAHGGEISITSPLNPHDYPEFGLSSERLGTRARIHLPK